jgi:hypothetical protein
MTARTLHLPRINRYTLLRGIAAGSAWGVAVAAALLTLSFYQCSTICLGEIIDTAAWSVTAGIAAMGPLVAFCRAEQIPAQ